MIVLRPSDDSQCSDVPRNTMALMSASCKLSGMVDALYQMMVRCIECLDTIYEAHRESVRLIVNFSGFF